METFHSPNEHNHADREAWSDEALDARVRYLGEQVKAPWIHGERLENIQKEIGLIAFEQWHRHNEQAQVIPEVDTFRSLLSDRLDSE